MKALLLAGDDASDAARWALDAGAATAESPIGRYAGTLALLVLGDDVGARVLGTTLRDRDDFPQDVADALVELAGADRVDYAIALEHILDSFEQRTDFLEDVPVADTVLVLQRLAEPRATSRSTSAPSPVAALEQRCRGGVEHGRRRAVRRAHEAAGRRARRLACERALRGVRLVRARDEEQHLARAAQHRQRQRDAIDVRLELRLGADRRGARSRRASAASG